MSLLLSLAVVLAFSTACAKPLKRMPWLFYVVAILLSLAALYLTYYPMPSQVLRSMAYAVQKAHVAFALFAVVMFIGVFSRGSKVRRHFNPVRAELSILGAIFALAHLAPYLSNYLSYATHLFSLQPSIIMSLFFAFFLLILLIPLTISSFNVIKKRMDSGRWKKLQRLAYVFFVLIFFHLLGYLAVPALGGSTGAWLNLSIYALLTLAYAGLRVRRALLDTRVKSACAKTTGQK